MAEAGRRDRRPTRSVLIGVLRDIGGVTSRFLQQPVLLTPGGGRWHSGDAPQTNEG